MLSRKECTHLSSGAFPTAFRVTWRPNFPVPTRTARTSSAGPRGVQVPLERHPSTSASDRVIVIMFYGLLLRDCIATPKFPPRRPKYNPIPLTQRGGSLRAESLKQSVPENDDRPAGHDAFHVRTPAEQPLRVLQKTHGEPQFRLRVR
ncbi:hypothetical protein QR680_008791 [Steinernema hermaphroditum]|uniref:Uncharacterized protein n=1 Tax=Steinernema hermaphroditum TaxID=289476 RepID=A0AA39M8Q6_9BILA|nr:hypothetical protein QR680_008791 [Steinernema hermaphroditum]